MTMSPDAFKRVMRLYPGAVNIIATGQAPHRTGMTATAVMSLSMDPVSIVCAVNRSAFSFQHVVNNGCFSVNTLGSHQIELAKLFSGQTGLLGDARFADEEWDVLNTGAPVLTSGLIGLDCKLVSQFDSGTHTLLVGQVMAGQSRPEFPALMYVDGQWTQAMTTTPA